MAALKYWIWLSTRKGIGGDGVEKDGHDREPGRAAERQRVGTYKVVNGRSKQCFIVFDIPLGRENDDGVDLIYFFGAFEGSQQAPYEREKLHERKKNGNEGAKRRKDLFSGFIAHSFLPLLTRPGIFRTGSV